MNAHHLSASHVPAEQLHQCSVVGLYSGKSPSPGLGPQGNLTAARICSQRPQLPEATRQSQLLLERLNPQILLVVRAAPFCKAPLFWLNRG